MRLSGGVDPGIGYSRSFAEWEAAHAAGLDLYKWETGEYPRWFMAKVVAWKNLHDLVEAHKQDALIKDMERNSKKSR